MRRPSRAWKPSLFPLTLLLALALPGSAALAMGSESAATPAARPAEQADYAAGKQAIASKNWQAALDAFNKVVASDPGNANAHNFLGYAYRKLGKLDLAFKHYEEALGLDPRHRGAHEYIGETYLLAGNLAQAEEHLAAPGRDRGGAETTRAARSRPCRLRQRRLTSGAC